MIIVMQLKSLTYTRLWKLNQTINKDLLFLLKPIYHNIDIAKKTLILILITFFINQLLTEREVCHKGQIIYCNQKLEHVCQGCL